MTFPGVMVDTINGSIQVSLFNATGSGTLETTTGMDKFSGIPGENIFYSWFPTVFLGIFMIVFLIISFTRYHRKFVRKRNAHNEYLEYQLAAKHPRIGSSLCKTHIKVYSDLAVSVGFGALQHVLTDGEHIKEVSERRSDEPPGVALSSKSTKTNKSEKQFRSHSMEIPGIVIENVHEGMDAERKYMFADKHAEKYVRKGKKNGTLKTSHSFQGRYDVISGSEHPANRIVDFNKGEFSANCENFVHGSNTDKKFGGFKTGASSNRELVIANDPNLKSRVDADYYSNRDNNPFISEEFDNIAICQHCRNVKHNAYYEDLGLPFAAQKLERKYRKETSPKPGGFLNYDTGHVLVEYHGEIDSPSYDSVRHLPVLDNQYYENVAKEIFKGPSFAGLRRNSAFQNDLNVVNNSTKVEVEVYTLNNNRPGESGTCDTDNTYQLHKQNGLDPACEPLYFDVGAKTKYSKDTFGCVFQRTNETSNVAKHINRNGQRKTRSDSRNRQREETSLASEDGKVFWLDIDNISTTSL